MPPTRKATGRRSTATRSSNRLTAVPASQPEKPGNSGLGRTAYSQIARGRARLSLIRDLAMGEWSTSEIAHQLGLPKEDIDAFAKAEAEAISEYKLVLAGKLQEETAGLWIAKKQNRMAELQAEYEDVDEALRERRDGGFSWSTHHKDMIRAKLSILRAVAEELGAYPQRSEQPAHTGNAVHYIIEGEDMEALQ